MTEVITRIGWIRNLLIKVLAYARIDRAVFYGISVRVWSAIAGPISALMIAAYFSPEIQGFYYTFASIIALQIFIELGLGVVIIHFASHEWAQLELTADGKIAGDIGALSRLQSVASIATKWFGIGGGILVIGLMIAGNLFFSQGPDYAISWQAPWYALCIITGIKIVLTPFWSLLEGCNQIRKLYGFRLVEGIVTVLISWVAIFSGAELWTASISAGAGILAASIFIRHRYWLFFRSLLFHQIAGPKIKWRMDMLPMQWRIAVSWISGYFAFSLFTPVLFKFHGPVIAGQMGMTWSLVGMLSFATAWLGPKVPVFGMLVSGQRYGELDRLFWQVTRTVVSWAVALVILIVIFVYGLEYFDIYLSDRLLPLGTTTIFLVGQLLVVSSYPFSAYLRAHKREPLMGLSVIMGILMILVSVIAGWKFGPIGIAVGYTISNIILLPWVIVIWKKCRHEWHGINV